MARIHGRNKTIKNWIFTVVLKLRKQSRAINTTRENNNNNKNKNEKSSKY